MDRIYINPTIDELAEVLLIPCAMLKTICDTSGNLYLWDGDAMEHRQIMDKYNIPDGLYSTANRYYMDCGGVPQLVEYADYWRTNIKGRWYADGEWLK